MNGPIARLLVSRAAILDAARAVRLSAQEPAADVDADMKVVQARDAWIAFAGLIVTAAGIAVGMVC